MADPKKIDPSIAPYVPGVYDEAANNINEPRMAQSRFTRTPITIERKSSANSIVGDPNNVISTGVYRPDNNQINVQLPQSKPSWSDMQNTIHHEDIHALLHSIKRDRSILPPEMLRIPSNEMRSGVKGIDTFLPENFGMSDRAGNLNAEIPAYMGAYQQGQIPKVTPEMSKDWIQRYIQSLPSIVGNQYRRINESNEAAQRFK